MGEAPSTMQAVEITEPGGPEVLKPCQRPTPVPDSREVRIRVAYAGVNRPDCLQRGGGYPPPPGASDLPGLEVSGVIDAVGQGVTGWQVGDAVCALTNGGGYAQYVTVPAGQCLPLPPGVDLRLGAGLPETFFTVWINAFERAKLQPRETLLVHGGSSGIGTTAIQLAVATGHRVWATCGSAAKVAYCEALGAAGINYKEQDFVAAVKAATDGRGVDVILDMVGGGYVQRNLSALANDGRLSQIAFLDTPKVQLDLLPLMLRRLTITGSTLRARTPEVKAQVAATLRQKVWPLFEGHDLKPPIDSEYPLVEAAKAHARMESSQHMGKLLLAVAP